MSKQKRIKLDLGVIGDVTQKLNDINAINDNTNNSTNDSTINDTNDSTMPEDAKVEGDTTTDSTINTTMNSTKNSTNDDTKNSSISITIKRKENYLDKHVQRAYYIRKDLEKQLIKTSQKTKMPKSELVNLALELLFENLKIEG